MATTITRQVNLLITTLVIGLVVSTAAPAATNAEGIDEFRHCLRAAKDNNERSKCFWVREEGKGGK